MSKKLFLVATETSGDLLGARLVHELKKKIPDLTVRGVGGDQLAAEGMDQVFHVRDFNVMGLFEVVSQLRRLKRMFGELTAAARRETPDAVVLIDSPDFNIRFAKAVRGLGAPLIYYVSPQVWAWRASRSAQIAGLVDHMLVLFEFEAPLYQRHGLATTWVGHPLVDELRDFGAREAFFAEEGFDPEKPLIALAPGSRKSEITKLAPVMAEVARARRDRWQFALPLAPALDRPLAEALLGDAPIRILPRQMRRLTAYADAAVVASGTATLETGLLKTPMVVGYKLSLFSFLLAHLLVKTPHMALINIVLDKRVVPELVQGDFCVAKIVPLLDELVGGGPRRAEMTAEFDRLEAVLGGGGASRRAAEAVEGFLGV